MAELATIARPYAEALFASVGGSEAPWLAALAQVASEQEVLQFAANPLVGPEEVFGLLRDAAKVQLDDKASNFLKTVVENKRLAALPEIAQQFQQLKNAASGVSDAVIYSAFPIEAAALSNTVAALEKHFARKLNARVEIEPELIGGIRVEVGDEVLDTSVKARLEQMKTAMLA